jgi:hypothetical protein
MSPRVLIAIVALATVVPSSAKGQWGGSRAPSPGSFFLHPERVPLRDGSLATAERGTLFVPLNRADTSRGVISVDVWRFRATAPSAVPPVVLLHAVPGGPAWPAPSKTRTTGSA